MKPTLEERFYSKINVNGPIPAGHEELGPCHVWTAGKRNGYGAFGINRKLQYAHRVAWELEKGQIPDGLTVDHKCHRLECVNTNHMRLATISQNAMNMKRSNVNTSGIKGVYWNKQAKKWRAQIKVDGHKIYIGSFDDPEDAKAAYSARSAELFGEFACLG